MHTSLTSEFAARNSTACGTGRWAGVRHGRQQCVRTLIEACVAGVFGVADHDLRSLTRGRARVALARQVSMYLAHVTLGLSLTDVGRLFVRDRTTVAHACAVIEDRRDEERFDRILELLERVVASLVAERGGAEALDHCKGHDDYGRT